MLNKKSKQIILIVVIIITSALLLVGSTLLFQNRKYNIISILLCIVVCIPFFIRFETKKTTAREVIAIAVMVVFSVIGRLLFAFLPGFKPITAIIIITALAFGANVGFMTGALSAIVSNLFFGQGPWTPFQMIVWGIIGFMAGILGKTRLKNNKVVLILLGLFSGCVFSILMDVWTVVNLDGYFNFNRYLLSLYTSLPFMAIYALSNCIFLLILQKPIGEKLERVKVKHRLFYDYF